MVGLTKLKHPLRLLGFSILACLIFLELSLSLLDPVGVYRLYNSTILQQAVTIPHPTGYAYDTGRYDWYYEARILPDGLRFVPDSLETSDCTIAFIGDSFTFGQGVNDNETFANLAAQTLGVRVLNTGRNGYNASQAYLQSQYYQADVYVYLAIANDNQRPVVIERYEHRLLTGLESYWTAISLGISKQASPSVYEARANENLAFDAFEQAIHAMQLQENIFMFSFEGVFTEYAFTFIPDFGMNYVSAADKHPNGLGHSLIFESMRPYIRESISEFCP